MKQCIICFAVIVVMVSAAIAGVPKIISYQGVLKDAATGDPVPDGPYSMTFKLYKNEKFEEAHEIAMEMYRLNPKHVNTLYNIAILHIKLGNKDKAYEWFEKAADAGGLRSFRRSYFERYIAMLEHYMA